MTTATIAGHVAISNDAPIIRTFSLGKPRISFLDMILAIGDGIGAAKEYEALVERGASPSDAARKALLGK